MSVFARLRGAFRRDAAFLALATAVLVLAGVARERASAPPAIDSYSTYDTATGGYRAAYELLGRLRVPVARFERRAVFLDASLGTLVYVDPLDFDPRQIAPTPAELAALEAWVRAGGALLYIGDDDAAAGRGVLHLPRVTSASSAFSAARSRDRRSERAGTRGALVSPEVRADGVRTIASEGWARYRVVRRDARVLVADAHGALVVATPFGRGRVTAVVDRALFANEGIARGDRARLLAAIVAHARDGLARRDGSVVFDETPHGYLVPEHWWLVVPRPFALAVGFGIVVLLVAFAGAAVRLGPPLVPRPRDDRSSSDFIDALATLYERKALASDALHDVAHATSAALARALGLAPGASQEAIAHALPHGDARVAFAELVALAASPSATSPDLVRGVALAHRLRKDHVAHGRH